MRLPFLDAGIRDGESARAHVERVAGSKLLPPWLVAQVTGAYVAKLLDRVDALERRVAELESR